VPLPAIPISIMRRCVLRAVALVLPLLGCSSPPKVLGITPYRMEIQQGNFVSKETVAQLKSGMTKEQVRFVLGTPLVTDIFHANRWDYVFYREPTGGGREEGRLTVYFDQGKLARVEGEGMTAMRPAEGGTR
jgi:outer membrane protein assembly factor BamE